MSTSLNIKNKDYVETAKELAAITGESITSSGLVALKRELLRQKSIKRLMQRTASGEDATMAAIREIQRRYAAIPSNSTLSDDDVLGYDDFGAPTR